MTATNTRPSSSATRLPGSAGHEQHRVAKGILAVLGALVLLVGIPVGLVLYGNPLPTTAPSRDWLDADVSSTLILNVLVVLVWVVWVHFVVCFLSEWRAIRAGRVPDNVVMGAGSQLLARQIVAGVLLLAGGASIASGLSTAATAAQPETTSGSAITSQIVQHTQEAQSAAREAVDARAERARSGAAAQLKMTTVKVPEGRHHDTLWGIAERVLGDPMRYKEIYQLNKDRIQPDGTRLTDADLIRPGWNLILPADASGPGIVLAQASTAPTQQLPSAPVQVEAPGDDTASTSTSNLAETPATAASDDSRTSADLGSLLLGGGLVLAGVLRALTARRGPFGEPDPAAAELAAVADVRRATFLDDALRSLAESRSAQDLPMPEVLFAYVNGEQVVLHLRGVVAAPEAPWTSSEDGASWTLLAEHCVKPGAGVPAPYPSLVNVATTHGFDLLIDLELAPGLVSLGGNDEIARELAMSMALDLATHAWSDTVDVVMVGFGDHYVDLDTGRVRRVDNLDQAIEAIDRGQAELGASMTRLGVTGVLQGRQRGVRAAGPTAIFLSGAPTSEQAQRLVQLTSGGRTAVSVVCVGDTASARWRFAVDGNGKFEATVLGISGAARRLDVPAQRQLKQLLAAATAQRELGAEQFESTAPATIAAASVAAAPQAAPAVDLATAPVRVRLLGPVSVEALGDVSDERRGLLTEVVVMAALHPEGLHPAVLRASIWPRGVDDDVVAARLAEVRNWLGSDEQGARFQALDDGRVQLRGVASDYAALAAAAQQPGAGELDALLAGLSTGTGPVFSGAGAHYSWLAFVREARQARLLVASVARRAAELAVSAGRPEVAEQALHDGLRMVPTSEALWRTLLRLLAQHRPTMVEQTISQMYSSLDGCGVKHEPETEALVKELAPRRERALGS